MAKTTSPMNKNFSKGVRHVNPGPVKKKVPVSISGRKVNGTIHPLGTLGAMHGPGRQELETVMRTAGKEKDKALRLFKNPKKAAMVGLGLGVAASVAMNRRGQGASSGRQSMYRY